MRLSGVQRVMDDTLPEAAKDSQRGFDLIRARGLDHWARIG
jgi:hypothetical protein